MIPHAALKLDGTGVTDAGLEDVFEIRSLLVLTLSNTQITDAGLKGIGKMTNLIYVDVFGSNVTAAGVAELQKAMPNCTIVNSSPKKAK